MKKVLFEFFRFPLQRRILHQHHHLIPVQEYQNPNRPHPHHRLMNLGEIRNYHLAHP